MGLQTRTSAHRKVEMNDNLDEIDPTSLVTYSFANIPQHTNIQTVTNIINQIAQNLAESSQELYPNIASLAHFSEPLANNAQSGPNATSGNSSPNYEPIPNAQAAQIQDSPESSQCIDLTKEQDDVMIITESPRQNRTNIRRTTRNKATTRRIGSQINETTDDIEVISTRRTRIPNPSPNETIIIDDDRNEASQAATRSDDAEVVQLCSPSKKQKTQIPNDLENEAEDDEIPKCPLCLENLTELKHKNKKLVATPCGHVMCNKCLDDYFKAGTFGNKSVLCPTCRTKLTKSKIITLFL